MAWITTKDVAMPVEEICWKYLTELYPEDPDRAATALSGYVEKTYDQNPGLASLGMLIPVGTRINMPEPESDTRILAPNRLWG